ncbi:MAG: hypothetical protein ABI624_14225 [Casimicrobiaceae bacterium]
MPDVTHYPLLVFLLSVLVLWLAACLGAYIRTRRAGPDELARDDHGIILAATLTLLGLIIGFSFSMATNRYDQRKNFEEEEANAIGTEFVRADLLADAEAVKLRGLLKAYLEQRILFYTTSDEASLRQINDRTSRLQTELWDVVKAPARTQPTPIVALVVAGMNDVLNSQGYSQAALWNRIPTAAWGLMVAIAICCNLLIGFGARSPKVGSKLFLVLPLVVSVAFLLIADIDSPRHGVIRVAPQNLHSLAGALRGQ